MTDRLIIRMSKWDNCWLNNSLTHSHSYSVMRRFILKLSTHLFPRKYMTFPINDEDHKVHKTIHADYFFLNVIMTIIISILGVSKSWKSINTAVTGQSSKILKSCVINYLLYYYKYAIFSINWPVTMTIAAFLIIAND